jgi:uncharacterized membrane protein
MATFLRTIEFLALSLWLGSDVFLSFVVAPGAFQVLPSRDAAGAVVGYSLTRMHLGGIALGIILLVARSIRTGKPSALYAAPGRCVILMLVLTAISQFTVSARMAALRVQMGSIQATAAGDPLLEQFSRLHLVSVLLESGVLLAGFAAMYFMVREASGR